jgi:mono/diheme cytochrome c family protein
MKLKIVSTSIILSILYSCGGSKSATPMVEAKKVATSMSIEEGKSLYEGNCAKCHKLYDATDFSKEDWKPIVQQMQKKAHLTVDQGVMIYNYLASEVDKKG